MSASDSNQHSIVKQVEDYIDMMVASRDNARFVEAAEYERNIASLVRDLEEQLVTAQQRVRRAGGDIRHLEEQLEKNQKDYEDHVAAIFEQLQTAERERDAARLVPPQIRTTLEKALRLDMTKPPVTQAELRTAIDLLPDSPSFYSSVAGIEQIAELQEQYQALQLAATRQLTPLDVAATHIDILRRKSEDYTASERDNVALIVEQHVNEARKALFDAISNPATESVIERKAREQRESPRGAPPTLLPDAPDPAKRPT